VTILNRFEEPEDWDRVYNFSGCPDNKDEDRAFSKRQEATPQSKQEERLGVYKVARTPLAARKTDGSNESMKVTSQ
jgi:hypothetical protein